ncbi:MAG: CoA transferase [Anaerolineae bacterium]|nr:CoA transferase [Anaerolineae bacterium]
MRVLDLSRLFPGPYCSCILADFGFEVIKIEPPGGGDWARYVPPLDPESGQGLLFRALNRGKKSMTLNLKSEEGRVLFLRLVETADVVLESFRPGVMERLGLGYEVLSRVNPRLVYCSLSGYGHTGPYRDRAGHDLNYQGLAGLLDLTGRRGGPPDMPGAPLADLGGALWAAAGILFALLQREQGGGGQRVEGSLLGGALSTMTLPLARHLGGEPMRRGASDLNGGVVCYNVYEAADGGYMTLSTLEPEFWAVFCAATGREDLLGQQFAPAIPGEPAYDELCALFRTRTRAEWLEVFAGVDACCEPVYNIGEALDSEPVRALNMLAGGSLLPPVTLSAHPPQGTDPAPALGEHVNALLGALGYSAEAIEGLRGGGIV